MSPNFAIRTRVLSLNKADTISILQSYDFDIFYENV